MSAEHGLERVAGGDSERRRRGSALPDVRDERTERYAGPHAIAETDGGPQRKARGWPHEGRKAVNGVERQRCLRHQRVGQRQKYGSRKSEEGVRHDRNAEMPGRSRGTRFLNPVTTKELVALLLDGRPRSQKCTGI